MHCLLIIPKLSLVIAVFLLVDEVYEVIGCPLGHALDLGESLG